MSDGSNWGTPSAPQPTTASTGPKWYAKKWVQISAAGIIGLAVGSAAGGGSSTPSGPTQAELDAANARATDSLTKANTAQADADKAVAAEKAKLAQQSAALDAREQKISGAETAAKASEISGEGLYEVGVDIKPGVYKAGPADSGNCYYARLSSLNSSDIIDNGNTSGPVTIIVKASDKALKLSGCATFHKTG